MSHLSSLGIFLLAFAMAYGVLVAMLSGRLPVALDRPNERSLHSNPIPRSGGVAVLAGILATGWLHWNGALLLLVAVAAALGALSLVDDFRGLTPALRFLFHLLAAIVVVAAKPAPGNLLFLLGAVLFIGWMINLYNFMDGANGLAGGMAVFGFAAYSLAALSAGMADLALLAGTVVAAVLAFLRFNFHPARIFLGDVGSVPLGFLAGAMGYWGWVGGAWPLWFPAFVFSPFVVDATVTLLRRLLRGEKFWQAHREHCYQKLIRMGWSHRRTALAEYGLMLAAACLGLLFRHADAGTVALLLAAAAVLYAAIIMAIDVKWRQFQRIGGS